VKIPFNPRHIRRYRDIVALIVKYGRPEMFRRLDSDDDLAAEAAKDCGSKAEELPKDLEKLGRAFIKLGQLLSSRGDLLLPRPC
jgi:ubiquinone biosynthesis protein